MKRHILGIIALACAGAASAQTVDEGPTISGNVRLQWDERRDNPSGTTLAAEGAPRAAAGMRLPRCKSKPSRGKPRWMFSTSRKTVAAC
jgi:hypothetical protein